jgi:hypothetical protein
MAFDDMSKAYVIKGHMVILTLLLWGLHLIIEQMR